MSTPEPSPQAADAAARRLAPAARRRLREVWRSAGWPWLDPLEAELIVAGLLARCDPAAPASPVRLTDLGLAALAAARTQRRSALQAHEALVERVALAMHREGRLVWRGLSLRAPVESPPLPEQAGPPAPPPPAHGLLFDGDEFAGAAHGAERLPSRRWAMAMPDVFSLRPSSREEGLRPIAHEIKVRRADLLSDLRQPAKGLAYRALAGESWYVLAEGIGEPEEIPAWHGVMVARAAGGLEVARPAPRRSSTPPLGLWLALARADRCRFDDDPGDQPDLAGNPAPSGD